jgi:hypothetical protein
MAGQEKPTTKQCPKCGNDVIGLIRSQNLKFCTNKSCNHWFEWTLDDGQKPLICSNRFKTKLTNEENNEKS